MSSNDKKLSLSLGTSETKHLKGVAARKIDAKKAALKKSGRRKNVEDTENSYPKSKRPFEKRFPPKDAHQRRRPNKAAHPAGQRPQRTQTTQQRKVRTDARAIALAVLIDIIHDQKLLDDAFANYPQLNKLAPRDRGFCHLLVMTILRHARRLDKVILSRLKDPASLPKELIMVLRIGVAQMLLLETPAHAAVSTSLDLLEKDVRLGKLKGVVNAVLRAIDRQRPDFPFSSAGFPDWLRNQLIEDWGDESALEIEQASLAEALLDLTIPNGAVEWAVKLHGTLLPTGSVRINGASDLTQLAGYDEGAWWVQDAAAALPAQLLMNKLSGHEKIWDICAAPGGKTAQFAAKGHQVIALDRSARRLERLKENMRRLHLDQNVRIKTQDACDIDAENLPAILLDAPCSATGTIRRHPDLLWQNRDLVLQDLIKTQEALLEKSAQLLKKDGVLLYCTCSLLREEGEEQIAKILAKDKSLRLSPIQPHELPGLDIALTPEGMMRIHPFHWPEAGGIDGFFAARLIKYR